MSVSRELELGPEPQGRSGREEVGGLSDSSNRSFMARRRWGTGLLEHMVMARRRWGAGLLEHMELWVVFLLCWSLDYSLWWSQRSGGDWGPPRAGRGIYGERERGGVASTGVT